MLPWASIAMRFAEMECLLPLAPGLDRHAAALVNFQFLASAVWTTDQAVAAMRAR
jgi:hypothetical protein